MRNVWGSNARLGKLEDLFREIRRSERHRRPHRPMIGVMRHTPRELVVNPQGGSRTRPREPVYGDPLKYYCIVRHQFNVSSVEVVPSSSVNGYSSVHIMSFSYIQERRPIGESARLYPSVCGLVACSMKYPVPLRRCCLVCATRFMLPSSKERKNIPKY